MRSVNDRLYKSVRRPIEITDEVVRRRVLIIDVRVRRSCKWGLDLKIWIFTRAISC